MTFSHAKGLDLEWCQAPDKGLLEPDLVIFLDLPIEVAMQRGGFGEERYEKRELQEKVREAFWELKKCDGGKGKEWVVIDATLSMEEVRERIAEVVGKVVEEVRFLPLKKGLWKEVV